VTYRYLNRVIGNPYSDASHGDLVSISPAAPSNQSGVSGQSAYLADLHVQGRPPTFDLGDEGGSAGVAVNPCIAPTVGLHALGVLLGCFGVGEAGHGDVASAVGAGGSTRARSGA